jgi:hypothetical protein
MPDVQLTEAEQFFYEHAGYSHALDESAESGRARAAILLAFAEHESESRGWYVNWSIDQDADTTPTANYYVSGNPQWEAVLYDAERRHLASLCGIDFAVDYSGTDPSADPYARVVAVELAQEALAETEVRQR